MTVYLNIEFCENLKNRLHFTGTFSFVTSIQYLFKKSKETHIIDRNSRLNIFKIINIYGI